MGGICMKYSFWADQLLANDKPTRYKQKSRKNYGIGSPDFSHVTQNPQKTRAPVGLKNYRTVSTQIYLERALQELAIEMQYAILRPVHH